MTQPLRLMFVLFLTRARHEAPRNEGEPRPYLIYDNNAMNVIGHDNIGVNFYMRKMQWDFFPCLFNNPPHLILDHLSVNNFAENMFLLVADNGHKIITGACIVKNFQAHDLSGWFWPILHIILN